VTALLVLVALSANLLVGRSHRAVRPGIADHLRRGAQVVAFQEAGGYLPVIRDLALPHGYRAPIVAPRSAGPGMDSSVLLVARETPLHASGVALVRAPWTGPRLKIRWPGRGIPWAVVDLDLGAGMICRTLVASVHGPTGRDRANTRAWRRYLRRLRRLTRRLARTHGATHVLFVGDWNCPAAAVDRLSVRRLLADRIDARIVKTGTSIDYAVTDLPLVGQKGPRHGSDHSSVRFARKAPR
jgi:hypothetical protein